jgi:hypothetical protein
MQLMLRDLLGLQGGWVAVQLLGSGCPQQTPKLRPTDRVLPRSLNPVDDFVESTAIETVAGSIESMVPKLPKWVQLKWWAFVCWHDQVAVSLAVRRQGEEDPCALIGYT